MGHPVLLPSGIALTNLSAIYAVTAILALVPYPFALPLLASFRPLLVEHQLVRLWRRGLLPGAPGLALALGLLVARAARLGVGDVEELVCIGDDVINVVELSNCFCLLQGEPRESREQLSFDEISSRFHIHRGLALNALPLMPTYA